MVIFLDRQHTGKPARPTDRGASHDLDGDGTVAVHEMEVYWSGYLGLMLETRLVQEGHTVIPISDGSYSDRHTRVNEYSARFPDDRLIYLALHFNAGGGSYCSMFYHHQSSKGQYLADCINEGLEQYIPQVSAFKSIPATSEDWTKNAFYTIRGVGRPVAICMEPLFIDTHSDLMTQEGMAKIVLGVAQGIQKWGNTHV